MNLPSLWLQLTSGVALADEGTFWMPPQASTFAQDLDSVFYFTYWVDVFFFVVLIGATALFAIQYKKKSDADRTHPTKGSHTLELIWAVVPTILALAMFATGMRVYVNSSVPPADSMDVRVVGQKWSWSFNYPEHGFDSEHLVVPLNTDVRLTMSSKDVIHSFYVPDFRIKKDVLPNRYTVTWFNAIIEGDHHIFCTEYCGDGHSVMLNTVKVLPQAEYDAWVLSMTSEAEASASLTGADLGEKLFTSKGCNGCHSIDGTRMVGPALNGIYGIEEPLEDGSTAKVDDNYLRESLMSPATKVVKGYAPSMPSFQGQLSDEEVNGMIDYLKSLDK